MADLSTERISFEAALANLLAAYQIEGSGGDGIITDATRLTLINLVKAKLDEVIPEGEGLQFEVEGDINVSDPLNLLINAILDEAAKRTLMNCPKHYLDPVKSTATATAGSPDTKIGYIVLPANFLRFISLKMADWNKPVDEVTEKGTPEYQMQFNPHVRGGVAKPKVINNWKYILNTTGGIVTVTLSSTNGGGTGYTPGTVTLTVVQSGGAGGTLTATANGAGQITSINSIATAGTGYSVSTELSTTAAAGSGCKINITAIVTAYTSTRVLEYFSVNYSHIIDWLYYIQETVAENVQQNLWDALTWMAAGMVLQITERVDLAKAAFEQEQMCYKSL